MSTRRADSPKGFVEPHAGHWASRSREYRARAAAYRAQHAREGRGVLLEHAMACDEIADMYAQDALRATR